MIDIDKQIDYWKQGAIYDLETAKILLERSRLLHALFFCHLTIEKILKAIVVKVTLDIAPRSHNLVYLSEKANLEFSDDDNVFIGILMKYQLQGRYPDYNPVVPSKVITTKYLNKTEQLLSWLQQML